jgi:hypothetical protein
MNILTNDKIKEYNFEINKFWGEVDSDEVTYGNFGHIMMTYERLCEKLPFVPFLINGSMVYLDGEIQLPFRDALFMAVGETCKKYNNKEFSIKYT